MWFSLVGSHPPTPFVKWKIVAESSNGLTIKVKQKFAKSDWSTWNAIDALNKSTQKGDTSPMKAHSYWKQAKAKIVDDNTTYLSSQDVIQQYVRRFNTICH